MTKMGESEREQLHDLKIETVEFPGGGEVSYSPERGGIITSLKLGGKEILFLNEDTLRNPQVNVKGGIPILFPNAGPIKSEEYPGLKQHGFARTSSGWEASEEQPEHGFCETLKANDASREVYPYDFRFSVSGQLEQGGSFTLTQMVKNLETEKALPVAMGLHPYFRVLNEEKENIRFDFDGGSEIEEQFEIWANSGTVSIENPRVKDPTAEMRISLPSLGTLIIEASPEYRRIQVWSLPGEDFVCIEPVMRDVGGLVDDPEMVEPQESLSAQMKIRLEQ